MWNIDVELVADWLSAQEREDLIYAVASLEVLAESGQDLMQMVWPRHRGVECWALPLKIRTTKPRTVFGPDLYLTVDGDVVTVFSGTGDALDSVTRRPSYRKQHRELIAAKSEAGLTLSQFVASYGVDREAVAECKATMLVEIGRRRLVDLRNRGEVTDDQMGLILDGEHASSSLVWHIEHEGIECESIAMLRKYVETCGSRLRVQVQVGEDWLAIA